MRELMLLAVAFLMLGPARRAEDEKAPTSETTHLWLASAAHEDGKVAVQIAEPTERGAGGAIESQDGVKFLPAGTVWKWRNFKKVALGKTVQAYRVNGDILNPGAVLKALEKPRSVAVFVRESNNLNKPDPFYLALLREDTIVLTVSSKGIYPAEP